MIINIDETKRIKRLVIEFTDDTEDFLEPDDNITLGSKKKSSKQPKTNKNTCDVSDLNNQRYNSRDSQILPTEYGDEITNEVVEKPVIPDVEDREVSVSDEMQNLVF